MKVAGLIILSFFFTHWVSAQQSPQSISTGLCGDTQQFCVDKNKSLNEACIVVKIPAGTCPIVKMEVDWNNNNSFELIPNVTVPKLTKDTSITISHSYDLISFIKSCELSKTIIPIVKSTFSDCGGKDPFESPAIVKFANPVTPTITVNPSPACIDQRVNFNVQLCPSQGATFTIDYGDGTSGKDLSKIYSKTGNYMIKVSAQNALCGASAPVSTQLTIIGPPKPAIADSGAIRSTKDSMLVCLKGGNIIRLESKKDSTNVTIVNWNISGPRAITYLQGNNRSERPLIRFNEAGIYTVTLTGENPCGIKVSVTKIVKVVDLPQPTLPPQNDTCQAFTYRIQNPISGGIYTLNGVPFDPRQGVLVSPNLTQPYIVEVTVNNECGGTPARRSFYVRDTAPVQILGLQNENTYCAGTSQTRVELTANQSGVDWTPKNKLQVVGGKTYFDLTQAGVFPVIAQMGSGVCAKSDTVIIRVVAATAQAENAIVCRGTKEVVLKRSSGPGDWQITNCGLCTLKGDTLSLSANAPDIVNLTFTAVAGGTCKSSPANVSVTISKPFASYQLPTAPYCENKNFAITNTSTGASSFEWIIDNVTKRTERNLSYTFSPGTHSIQLKASVGSCLDDTSMTVKVLPLPTVPVVTITPNTVCDGQEVAILALSVPTNDVTYRYDYGNGQTSQGFQPVSQKYSNKTTTIQTFVVTVTAENSCDKKTNTQTVQVKPRPTARIGVDSSTVRCPPASITFTNGSLAHISTESVVNFGDGTGAIKQPANIFKYQYDNKDTVVKFYTVFLTVKNECDVARDSITIRIFPRVVKAYFNASTFRPCINQSITLRDASTPGVTKMEWFDQKGWVSVGSVVSYTPNSIGKQRIYLVATGCSIDTTWREIDVQAPVQGSFKVDNTTICAGQRVIVKNTTETNKIKKFEWRDSEGVKDSLNFDFAKTYTKAGQYQVTLTVVSNDGCLSTTQPQVITIRTTPSPEFSIVGDSIKCNGQAIVLKAVFENALSYEWVENGQKVKAGQIWEIQRPLGSYDIGLKVSDGTCADSSYKPSAFTITECTIHIPDVFTPQSGDNVNDFYTVFGQGISRIKSMRVYNRWGEQLFYKENFVPNQPTLGWDGGLNPPGEYIVEVDVEYLDGVFSEKKRAGFYLIKKKKE